MKSQLGLGFAFGAHQPIRAGSRSKDEEVEETTAEEHAEQAEEEEEQEEDLVGSLKGASGLPVKMFVHCLNIYGQFQIGSTMIRALAAALRDLQPWVWWFIAMVSSHLAKSRTIQV